MAHYYRSADLLQAQATAYRAANNEEQLYVMLVRLISLVVETISKHRLCVKTSAQHEKYLKQVVAAAAEAEKLQIILRTKHIPQPRAYTSRRPANTVQITDTNALPDIDWAGAAAPPPAAAAAAAAGIASAGYVPLDSDLEWPPRSAGSSSSTSGTAAAAGAGAAALAGAAAATGGTAAQWAPVSYSGHYAPTSQQTLQKHALFAPKGPRALQQQGSQGSSSRARYPAFDSSPIDTLWANSTSSGSSASALPDVERLAITSSEQEQQQQQQQPQPSAGPSLGPQELEVQSMPQCSAQANGSCAVAPVTLPSVAEAAAAAAAGPKSLSKRLDLRDVHISVALMNDFLHYAANNTRRGIESCGILAGRLSASDSRFTITTLIVPKQTGTSDTVEMLGEEEVWEAESSRELVPLGWIHTHPTQTCFLSSVDIHTQCGYQTMLEESVAIVMAPTDSRKKCGIFRLTTPAGLEHVQRCSYRGFHASCNSEMYELCGHVYLNPNAKHEVIDLR